VGEISSAIPANFWPPSGKILAVVGFAVIFEWENPISRVENFGLDSEKGKSLLTLQKDKLPDSTLIGLNDV